MLPDDVVAPATSQITPVASRPLERTSHCRQFKQQEALDGLMQTVKRQLF